jgi:hypothetical protein
MRRRDVDKSRDDLAAFAKLARHSLTKWQAASLRLEARTSYIVGPRQSGKSRSAALVAAWRAFREPDHHVLIVSASELGAKRLLATIADLVTASPVLSASVVDEQASLIRLTNGSSIRSVPASVKAIRGWSINTLIFDEATELGDEIIDLALPVTAARADARVVFLSTAGAPVGRAYETFMAGLGGSDLVRSYSWRLRDAKWISKAAIEHARLTLPPWRFQAEYESEWLGSVDALFPPSLLQRCTASLDLPELAELRGGARLLGGIDWADAGQDQTACVAIARIPARGEVHGSTYVAWLARLYEPGTEVTQAARDIAIAPARWSVLSPEVNGLGAGAAQVLRDEIRKRRSGEEQEARIRRADPLELVPPVKRWNPTTTTWERKADALGRLRGLAERGKLILARSGRGGEDFMRQLATVRVEHRAHSVAIEAPTPSARDDAVDALYLSSGSYSLRSHREPLNVLAQYAERHLPEPELSLGETVEVGDLEVERTPHLISVASDEVTRPPGAAPRDPRDEALEVIRRQYLAHKQAMKEAR